MSEALPFDELVSRCYPGLKQLAAIALRELRDGSVLASGPTSVVGEAVGRIAAQDRLPSSEEHLRGLAMITIRRVIADRRRRRNARKRGEGWTEVELDEAALALSRAEDGGLAPDDAALVRDALSALARIGPQAAEVLILVALNGRTHSQVAEDLAIGASVVERDVRFARAWIEAWVADRRS